MAFTDLAGRYALAALTMAAGVTLCLVGVLATNGGPLVPIGAAILGAGAGSRIPDMPGNRF